MSWRDFVLGEILSRGILSGGFGPGGFCPVTVQEKCPPVNIISRSYSFSQSKIQFTAVKFNSKKVFFNALQLLKSPSM